MENIMDNFLSIKEAVQRYSASCDGKIKTPFDKLFIKAMLAGMMIAIGVSCDRQCRTCQAGSRCGIPGWPDDGHSDRSRAVYW